MRFVFLGPPGAGKGTQAVQAALHFGIPHVSTGDLLRSEVVRKSELGEKASKFMTAGDLVPDELVVEMIRARVREADCVPGYLLDGFPRTITQAQDLDEAIQDCPLDVVVFFAIADSTVVQRISGRRVCRSCGATYHVKHMPEKVPGSCDSCGGSVDQRDDDCEDSVRNRLVAYRRETTAVVEYYRRAKVLSTIDAGRSVESVHQSVMAALGGS